MACRPAKAAEWERSRPRARDRPVRRGAPNGGRRWRGGGSTPRRPEPDAPPEFELGYSIARAPGAQGGLGEGRRTGRRLIMAGPTYIKSPLAARQHTRQQSGTQGNIELIRSPSRRRGDRSEDREGALPAEAGPSRAAIATARRSQRPKAQRGAAIGPPRRTAGGRYRAPAYHGRGRLPAR